MTREPTEMELRVAKVVYDLHPGTDYHGKPVPWKDREYAESESDVDPFEVARAAIRAMHKPTDAMTDIVWENQEIQELVEDNTPPINAVWKAMIDAASPQEE